MSGKETLDGEQSEALEAVEQKGKGITIWSARAVAIETFTLTLIAEWGDRTQFATITLTSFHQPYGVVLGAILVHVICATIVVSCGKLITGCISERLMTALGSALFIGFGILIAVEST